MHSRNKAENSEILSHTLSFAESNGIDDLLTSLGLSQGNSEPTNKCPSCFFKSMLSPSNNLL